MLIFTKSSDTIYSVQIKTGTIGIKNQLKIGN